MDRPYDPPRGLPLHAQPQQPYAFDREHGGISSSSTPATLHPPRDYPDYAHYSMPPASYPALSPTSPTDTHLAPPIPSGSNATPNTPVRDKRVRAKAKRFWLGDKDPTLTAEHPPSFTAEDIQAEKEYMQQAMFDWRELSSWRFWIRKEWWYWYIIGIVITVLVVLMTVYHDQIVRWLTPATNWMKDLPGGWAIPIGVLFVLSFPPLFGGEIVCILCGLVWGLWAGFGIVAAGTLAGEIGNYVAFKYWCRSRADKYERKNVNYGCLAHVMREGGFWIIFLARLSAIPGHLTTAVFATCGMNFWIFLAATFFSLPKQLIVVYLGVLFKEQDKSSKDKIISYTVLGVGIAWYIYDEMRKARVHVWRKARMQAAAKGIAMDDMSFGNMPLYDEEAQANAPILNRQDDATPNPERGRESYVNPYEIRYKREGEMSVYHVDAMTERVQLEEDIASRWHSGSTPSAPTLAPPSSFPQPQTRVKREPSAASAFYAPGQRVPEAIPSNFPTPQPKLLPKESRFPQV